MVVAIHQPNFLPNLGFFYKMVQADVFVVATNLQFGRGEGWQRRHKIVVGGQETWLTVPVHGSQNQLIRDVRINNGVPWQRKHVRALRMAYGRTAEADLLGRVLALYERPYERLVEVNMAFIELLREVLGVKTRLVLDEEVGGRRAELLVNVCTKYGAAVYLSGLGGKRYMTAEHFAALEARGVRCCFVERDVTGHYPYSTVHYLLTRGVAAVRRVVVGQAVPA